MNVIEITKENFEKEVLQSDKPVIVDFNASWCGPCQMLRPVIEELAAETKDIRFGAIDIDEQDELAYEYNVASVPCLVKFVGGKEVSRSLGFKPKPMIAKFIGE